MPAGSAVGVVDEDERMQWGADPAVVGVDEDEFSGDEGLFAAPGSWLSDVGLGDDDDDMGDEDIDDDLDDDIEGECPDDVDLDDDDLDDDFDDDDLDGLDDED